jgi:hypothetical protein
MAGVAVAWIGVAGAAVGAIAGVGRTQHRANRAVLVEGDPLPVSLTNARRRVVPIGGER